jgi:ATP synthase protein I
MSDPELAPKPKLPASEENMIEQVEVRAGRMIRAKNHSFPHFWRAVAMVGLVGWTVVVPMLAGIAVGTWIDRNWPSRFSWTLMLLVGGLAIGCMNAWTRIRDEQEDR